MQGNSAATANREKIPQIYPSGSACNRSAALLLPGPALCPGRAGTGPAQSPGPPLEKPRAGDLRRAVPAALPVAARRRADPDPRLQRYARRLRTDRPGGQPLAAGPQAGGCPGVRSRTSGSPLPGYSDGIRVANCRRAVRHRAAAGRPAARKGCRPAHRAGQRRHRPPSRRADSRRETRLRHRPATLGHRSRHPLDPPHGLRNGSGGDRSGVVGAVGRRGCGAVSGAARQPAGGRSPRMDRPGRLHLFRCTSRGRDCRDCRDGRDGRDSRDCRDGRDGRDFRESGSSGSGKHRKDHHAGSRRTSEPFGSRSNASTGNNVRTVEHPDREAGVSREPGCLRCCRTSSGGGIRSRTDRPERGRSDGRLTLQPRRSGRPADPAAGLHRTLRAHGRTDAGAFRNGTGGDFALGIRARHRSLTPAGRPDGRTRGAANEADRPADGRSDGRSGHPRLGPHRPRGDSRTAGQPAAQAASRHGRNMGGARKDRRGDLLA